MVTTENTLLVTISENSRFMCLKVIFKNLENNFRIQPLEALNAGIVHNQRIEGNQVL
jgi:hypothetical protein